MELMEQVRVVASAAGHAFRGAQKHRVHRPQQHRVDITQDNLYPDIAIAIDQGFLNRFSRLCIEGCI